MPEIGKTIKMHSKRLVIYNYHEQTCYNLSRFYKETNK